MTTSILDFKIVPFSASLILNHRLHLSDDDGLGESFIKYILEGNADARMPERMAVCFEDGVPIGVAVVFILKPGDEWRLSYDFALNQELHGFLNVFVKQAYRGLFIGSRLLDLAMKNFERTYPSIGRVMVSRLLKGKLGKWRGIEPVYARLGKAGFVMLMHTLVRHTFVTGFRPWATSKGATNPLRPLS